VISPSLLLADEPTGNLDSQTSAQIMAIMQALNARGLTIVLVTHEPDVAAYCPRQVRFRDGRVLADSARTAFVTEQHYLPQLSPASPGGSEEKEVIS
jgi:putative ABC transport system ATP-binding protein